MKFSVSPIALILPLALAIESHAQSPITPIPTDQICNQISGTLGYQASSQLRIGRVAGGQEIFFCGTERQALGQHKSYTQGTLLVRHPEKSRLHCVSQVQTEETVSFGRTENKKPIAYV